MQRSGHRHPLAIPGRTPAASAAPPIDWPQWLRNTERKRRQESRHSESAGGNGSTPSAAADVFWAGYFADATDSSFRLDGLLVPRGDLLAALAPGWTGKATCVRRQQQRVRNHVAILRHLETRLRRNIPLKPDDVIRWYTSVACGLSTTRLDEPTTARLHAIVRQINSPHLRLAPAVQEIARLHHQLLADPVVPGFNGILARLILRYHLGRCGLPPVVFVPETDAALMPDEHRLLARLLELIDKTYGMLTGRT